MNRVCFSVDAPVYLLGFGVFGPVAQPDPFSVSCDDDARPFFRGVISLHSPVAETVDACRQGLKLALSSLAPHHGEWDHNVAAEVVAAAPSTLACAPMIATGEEGVPTTAPISHALFPSPVLLEPFVRYAAQLTLDDNGNNVFEGVDGRKQVDGPNGVTFRFYPSAAKYYEGGVNGSGVESGHIPQMLYAMPGSDESSAASAAPAASAVVLPASSSTPSSASVMETPSLPPLPLGMAQLQSLLPRVHRFASLIADIGAGVRLRLEEVCALAALPPLPPTGGGGRNSSSSSSSSSSSDGHASLPPSPHLASSILSSDPFILVLVPAVVSELAALLELREAGEDFPAWMGVGVGGSGGGSLCAALLPLLTALLSELDRFHARLDAAAMSAPALTSNASYYSSLLSLPSATSYSGGSSAPPTSSARDVCVGSNVYAGDSVRLPRIAPMALMRGASDEAGYELSLRHQRLQSSAAQQPQKPSVPEPEGRITRRTIETPHPYPNAWRMQWDLHFPTPLLPPSQQQPPRSSSSSSTSSSASPSASSQQEWVQWMVVSFAPQCSSAQPRDKLSLFSDAACTLPVQKAFYGAAMPPSAAAAAVPASGGGGGDGGRGQRGGSSEGTDVGRRVLVHGGGGGGVGVTSNTRSAPPAPAHKAETRESLLQLARAALAPPHAHAVPISLGSVYFHPPRPDHPLNGLTAGQSPAAAAAAAASAAASAEENAEFDQKNRAVYDIVKAAQVAAVAAGIVTEPVDKVLAKLEAAGIDASPAIRHASPSAPAQHTRPATVHHWPTGPILIPDNRLSVVFESAVEDGAAEAPASASAAASSSPAAMSARRYGVSITVTHHCVPAPRVAPLRYSQRVLATAVGTALAAQLRWDGATTAEVHTASSARVIGGVVDAAGAVAPAGVSAAPPYSPGANLAALVSNANGLFYSALMGARLMAGDRLPAAPERVGPASKRRPPLPTFPLSSPFPSFVAPAVRPVTSSSTSSTTSTTTNIMTSSLMLLGDGGDTNTSGDALAGFSLRLAGQLLRGGLISSDDDDDDGGQRLQQQQQTFLRLFSQGGSSSINSSADAASIDPFPSPSVSSTAAEAAAAQAASALALVALLTAHTPSLPTAAAVAAAISAGMASSPTPPSTSSLTAATIPANAPPVSSPTSRSGAAVSPLVSRALRTAFSALLWHTRTVSVAMAVGAAAAAASVSFLPASAPPLLALPAAAAVSTAAAAVAPPAAAPLSDSALALVAAWSTLCNALLPLLLSKEVGVSSSLASGSVSTPPGRAATFSPPPTASPSGIFSLANYRAHTRSTAGAPLSTSAAPPSGLPSHLLQLPSPTPTSPAGALSSPSQLLLPLPAAKRAELDALRIRLTAAPEADFFCPGGARDGRAGVPGAVVPVAVAARLALLAASREGIPLALPPIQTASGGWVGGAAGQGQGWCLEGGVSSRGIEAVDVGPGSEMGVLCRAVKPRAITREEAVAVQAAEMTRQRARLRAVMVADRGALAARAAGRPPPGGDHGDGDDDLYDASAAADATNERRLRGLPPMPWGGRPARGRPIPRRRMAVRREAPGAEYYGDGCEDYDDDNNGGEGDGASLQSPDEFEGGGQVEEDEDAVLRRQQLMPLQQAVGPYGFGVPPPGFELGGMYAAYGGMFEEGHQGMALGYPAPYLMDVIGVPPAEVEEVAAAAGGGGEGEIVGRAGRGRRAAMAAQMRRLRRLAHDPFGRGAPPQNDDDEEGDAAAAVAADGDGDGADDVDPFAFVPMVGAAAARPRVVADRLWMGGAGRAVPAHAMEMEDIGDASRQDICVVYGCPHMDRYSIMYFEVRVGL